MIHDEDCPRKGKWFINPECRAFSTDGTALGADIAHTFGTTDEEAIRADELNARKQALTGMKEEQADWESDGADDWIWDRPVTME